MPKGSTITRKDNPDKVRMFAKGGKVKKAEGGDVDFENTPASISSDITAPSYSFGEEFSAARKSGKKTFEYKGKKYTTEMAKPAAKPAARPAAAASRSNLGLDTTAPAAAKPKVVAGTPTVTASMPASKPVSNPTRAAVAKPTAVSTPAAKPTVTASSYKTAQERSRAAMARENAADATKRAALKKEGDARIRQRDSRPMKNYYGEDRRPTPKPTPPVLSSKDSRAPAVGAEAKARRARLDAQGVGFAKGGNANFIKGAIKKPGALRASLGAKPGKPIPAGKLDKASKAPGKLGQRARFAEMLRGFRKNKE
jgi:hypothetical protein